MKIQEVSRRTGLSKKTIRFYEAEGLFSPEKREKNGREYREYTEEHLQALLEIAVLRRARFTLREIQEMDRAPETIPAIFSEYQKSLQRQKQELELLLAAAAAIDGSAVKTRRELSALLEQTAGQVSLPPSDVHPRFRRLDDLETLLSPEYRVRLSRQDHRRKASYRQALVASMDMGMAMRKVPRELGISNEQKMAVLNMLREDE